MYVVKIVDVIVFVDFVIISCGFEVLVRVEEFFIVVGDNGNVEFRVVVEISEYLIYDVVGG